MSAEERRGSMPRLPPPAAIAALAAGGVLFAIAFSKGVRDPDGFWHLTVGRLIAESGSVPSADPFSFTWAGQPWTPHEWLTELLMHALVATIGEPGALAVFALVPAVMLLVVAWTLDRLGVRTLVITGVLTLVALVTAAYATMRPQVLSWLLFAVLIALLVSMTAARRRRLLVLVPLFALWANLHGLYFVGLGVVAAYALFTLLGRTPLAGHPRWAVGALAGALVGAMLTPAGPLGVLYPFRYRQAWGLENIQEWQSPDFHDPAHWPLLGMVLLLMATGGRGAPGWLRTIAFVGTIMALVALRNSPVAAVVAAPAVAMAIERLLGDRRAERRSNARIEVARRVMELGVAVVVVASALAIFVGPTVGRSTRATLVDAGYPVAAVDAIEARRPASRILAEYGWGGYVIARLHEDGGRVFVDGRNDMYDESILEAYSTVVDADDGWAEVLDRYGVDLVLVTPDRPLAKGVGADAGWCEAFRDEVAVVLARTCP